MSKETRLECGCILTHYNELREPVRTTTCKADKVEVERQFVTDMNELEF